MKADPGFIHPTGLLLPRVVDRKGWLYLDKCRVSRDNYGVLATANWEDTGPIRIYLPIATLHALLLGPGTSITSPALAALADSACTVVITASSANRYYSSFTPRQGSTTLLHQQAAIHADPEQRIAAARALYLTRFPGTPIPEHFTLEQLRGMEGSRVKALYKILAQQHKVGPFRRSYDPHDFESSDPVNQALSEANACIYGVTLTAIATLGCHPGFGIIHEGHPRAFAHDIADLYKTEYTIPLAFALARHHDPAREARRRLAHDARLLKLAPRIVHDINTILKGPHETHLGDATTVELWDPTGNVPARTLYTADPSAEPT